MDLSQTEWVYMYAFLQVRTSQFGERTAWLLLHANLATVKLPYCTFCNNSERRKVTGEFHSEDAKCTGVPHPPACPKLSALIGNE